MFGLSSSNLLFHADIFISPQMALIVLHPAKNNLLAAHVFKMGNFYIFAVVCSEDTLPIFTLLIFSLLYWNRMVYAFISYLILSHLRAFNHFVSGFWTSSCPSFACGNNAVSRRPSQMSLSPWNRPHYLTLFSHPDAAVPSLYLRSPLLFFVYKLSPYAFQFCLLSLANFKFLLF